jgi:phosphinothricin acetyltransferase
MNTENTKIRHHQQSDLPSLVEIYNLSIPSRTATADLVLVQVADKLAWFNEHNHTNRPLYVAETDGVISGYLSVQDFYPRAGYGHTIEIGLYVHPQFQRKGIATTLLKKLENEADQRKIHSITAFVFAHNKDSIHLFKRMKYEEWGKLPSVASLDGKLADLIIFGKNVRLMPTSVHANWS